MYYIILDEIQKVEDFESVLNGFLHIENVDIYVTGSNSKFLSSDIITEFRGRGDEIRIYPLSFSEFSSAFKNHEIIKCLNKVHDGCEWVLKGEGYATEKLDGTCCMIKDNQLYRRYDYKDGRRLPSGAVPCQKEPDPITGHWPHWISSITQILIIT